MRLDDRTILIVLAALAVIGVAYVIMSRDDAEFQFDDSDGEYSDFEDSDSDDDEYSDFEDSDDSDEEDSDDDDEDSDDDDDEWDDEDAEISSVAYDEDT